MTKVCPDALERVDDGRTNSKIISANRNWGRKGAKTKKNESCSTDRVEAAFDFLNLVKVNNVRQKANAVLANASARVTGQ